MPARHKMCREEPFTFSEKTLAVNVSLQLCMGRKPFRVSTIVRNSIFSRYAALTLFHKQPLYWRVSLLNYHSLSLSLTMCMWIKGSCSPEFCFLLCSAGHHPQSVHRQGKPSTTAEPWPCSEWSRQPISLVGEEVLRETKLVYLATIHWWGLHEDCSSPGAQSVFLIVQ